MKILHGPVNVGNQPWVLSREERKLGLESDLVVAFDTWLNYGADKVLTSEAYPSGLGPKLRRASFGLKSAFDYDVIHYYFGQSYIYRAGRKSVFNFADLKLAKRLGKRIFMTLQGCDIRQAGASNARNPITMCAPDGCSAYSTCLKTLDALRRQLEQEILPLCDRVFYLNPELGHHAGAKAEFLPYASCDIHAIKPIANPVRERPVILHAPSNPSIKGTHEIEAALDELRAEFSFDYVRVEGLAHEQAMRLYRDADLVIDQIKAGWYGGFAVEVMAMGKPVAAYIREEDLHFVPPDLAAKLPVLRLHRATLTDDLRAILAARESWVETGLRSRAFVERWHDPARIALAMRHCYQDPAANFVIAEQ